MQSGKRNRRCIIERRSDLQNATGEVISTWVEYAKRWSFIRPLSGTEVVQAKQVGASTTHELTMLYCDGLNPDMRIRYGERIFNIKSIVNAGDRNKEQIVQAEESLNA